MSALELSTNHTLEEMKKSAQKLLEEADEESALKLKETETNFEKEKKDVYEKALAEAATSYHVLLQEKDKAKAAEVEACKDECFKSHAEEKKRAVAEAVEIEHSVANRLLIDLKSCKSEWLNERRELERRLEIVKGEAMDNLRRTAEQADAQSHEADEKSRKEVSRYSMNLPILLIYRRLFLISYPILYLLLLRSYKMPLYRKKPNWRGSTISNEGMII